MHRWRNFSAKLLKWVLQLRPLAGKAGSCREICLVDCLLFAREPICIFFMTSRAFSCSDWGIGNPVFVWLMVHSPVD